MKAAGIAAGAALIALASGTAAADWSGKGRIGGVLARGNTETSTANLNFDVTRHLERWDHKFGGSMLRTLSEGLTSADRWELRAESDYRPTRRTFLFTSVRYEQDQFTDYAYQATGAIGVGYHFVASAKSKLDGRFGVGTRRAELRLTDDTEADAILRIGVDFQRFLTANTSLYDRLLVETGETNTFVQNALGLEVKMTQTMSVALGYELRYNSEVLPGTENSDQVFTAGIAAAF
jgi:putative salt-induced outer membrane protein